MLTSLDSCPRCGFALDQPTAPPTTHPLPTPPPVTSYVPAYPAAPVHRTDPATPAGLSAASVPKILLGLGATCLLVAAVIFLAVAWSWLGVGGRTAVLVGLTVATGLAGQWLVRRELGVGAEALTVVSLGLVVLDVFGAYDAGWVDGAGGSLTAVTGAALLLASLAQCLPATRLFAPQVVAPMGLGLAILGGAPDGHDASVSVVSLLCFTALALLGRRIGAVVLPWTAGGCALLSGATFGVLAADEASAHPTLPGLWVEGHGTGLLVLAGILLLPWAIVPRHDDLRQLACASSVSVLTLAVVLPVLDEGATAITLAAAVCTLVWALVSAAAPPRWYAVPRAPLAGSLLVLVPVPAVLAVQGAANLLTVGSPFSADWRVRLDPAPHVADPLLVPLAVVVVAVAAALTLPRSGRFGYALLGVGYLTALLTAAQYAVPLVAFVAALGPLGLAVAHPSAVLTFLTLGEVTLVAGYVVARRSGGSSATSAFVLPAALGGFLWVGGHLVDAPDDHRSLVALVALGLLAVAVPRVELETAAATVAAIASLEGVVAAADHSVALAVHLTVAGALVTVSSLVHRDHRPLAWLGGLLLAAATWTRLWDLGVHAPEAYTLPTAVVLVLVGLDRLHRDMDTRTSTALLPGLGLAVVPTLLWALVDPLSTRAVVIGVAALALLLGGTALRWTAPVLVGWLAGAALVLRELAPYAVQTPQWVLIGAAGTVLIAAGISWEARLRDVRRAAGYLARLR